MLFLLESLITSKTRMRLILKFFLNPDCKAYLRGLAEEFGESTNSVRIELNRLSQAGLLETNRDGRTIMYQANKKNALFSDLHNIAKKCLGIDKLVDDILAHLGTVESAFVTGDYAHGMDSGIIDLVIVGEIDRNYLQFLVDKTENMIKRKIRLLVINSNEYQRYKDRLAKENALLVWDNSNSKNNENINVK